MKLKTKLFASFGAILTIIMVLVGSLTWMLSEVNRMARVVDNTDSSLASALVAQGELLRFLMYNDFTFADAAQKSLDESKAYAKTALTFIVRPQFMDLNSKIQKDLDLLDGLLKSAREKENRRLQIEENLKEPVRMVTAGMETLRVRMQESLALDNSPRMLAVVQQMNKVADAFLNARLMARLYTGSSTPENERRALEAIQNCVTLFHELDASITEQRNRDVLEQIFEELKAYEASNRNYIAWGTENAKDNARTRELFQQLQENSINLSRMVSDTLISNGNNSIFSLFAGAALAFLVSIVVVFVLTRNVLLQLGKDPGELALIARRVTDGDYNIDDGAQKVGVFGNIVAMVAALREHIENAQRESARAAEESQKALVAMRDAETASAQALAKTDAMLKAADKLEQVAGVVSSASTELAAQIEQSERGAAQQAARVTETATAMEEMNSTVLEVARSASNAADTSAGTRDKAEAGAHVVAQSVRSIQEVQEQSLLLKNGMTQLDENARAINQIMGVISDIADQTNLLALNAAIEAARAGDAGRGFAVVADEVRNLAEKTMASTSDVGNAIKAIQHSVAESMAQVDASVAIIETATNFANQSGEALTEIVAMADTTADQVRAIATASEQQSASSEEISQSIVQVNAIAEETSSAMQEAARAVSDLASQAQVLSGLIEDMKVG